MNKMSHWETLTRYFLDMVNHPRYGMHAREMYKLLLILREEPKLADVNAQADYLYVTFWRDGVAGCVIISNEAAGCYTLSVSTPRQTYDDHKVATAYVSALLIYHLDRLREAVPLHGN